MSTKEKLIETAGRLFAERGFDGVSIRDIVRAAGVNLGAVTYHFGGKDGLFSTVIARKIEPLRNIAMEIVKSSMKPKEKLSAILYHFAMHIMNRDPSLKAFFAESLHGGQRLPGDAVKTVAWRNRMIGDIIREGIDQGDFKPCDVESVTWIFFGLLMPYVLHQPLMKTRYRRGPYPKAFVKKVVDSALLLFFTGLEKKR